MMRKLQRMNAMLDWEAGDLSVEETIALFQELVNSGLVWQLQGCYGRIAKVLLDVELIQSSF